MAGKIEREDVALSKALNVKLLLSRGMFLSASSPERHTRTGVTQLSVLRARLSLSSRLLRKTPQNHTENKKGKKR